MLPDVIAVLPKPGHRLELTFAKGEHRQLDMPPYLDYPVFQRLRNRALGSMLRRKSGLRVRGDYQGQ